MERSLFLKTAIFPRLSKKPSIYRNQGLSTVFIRASHLSLPNARLTQCFANIFPWRNPSNTCSYRETLSVKTKGKIIKRRLLPHGDYSNIPNRWTKILAIFRGIFIIFAQFQNNYVFIPLFPSEPLTEFRGTLRFHGTLFEKHRINAFDTLSSHLF
jgi:hypothetical protein